MAKPEDRMGAERIDASTVTTLADLAAVLRRLRRREARLRQGRELTYQQLAPGPVGRRPLSVPI